MRRQQAQLLGAQSNLPEPQRLPSQIHKTFSWLREGSLRIGQGQDDWSHSTYADLARRRIYPPCTMDTADMTQRLAKVRNGFGAAVMPPEVKRLVLTYAAKINDGHMGPRLVPHGHLTNLDG